MLAWAWKSLMATPLRLLAGAGGVAAALLLVVFFHGVFKGEAERIVAYPMHAGADVWVMQKGVSNMHMASSLLWDWKEIRVAAVPEVESTVSILYLNSIVRAGGRNWFSYIVGIGQDAAYGGPWRMHSGQALPAPGEAVIPWHVARMSGIGIGDEIEILDRRLKVVGLSEETFSMANSITFVSRRDLADLMNAGGSVSYILVKIRPGAEAAAVARRIKEEVEKVNALAAEDFIARDREMAMQMGTEIIRMMTIIGALLAVLVVAFSSYQQVVGRARELAVARAVGFTMARLQGAVLFQSMLMTLLGVALTAILAYTVLPLIPLMAPQIAVQVEGWMLAQVAVAGVAVAVAASAWPAYRIGRLDPMLVFQE